jgi:hypothetical protein
MKLGTETVGKGEYPSEIAVAGVAQAKSGR